MRGEPGFFDVDERLRRLSDLGDQLLAFTAAVDFDMFRPELTRALAYSDGSQGGRPPFDPVMMFKILVIQAANALSDERAEFLINDRLHAPNTPETFGRCCVSLVPAPATTGSATCVKTIGIFLARCKADCSDGVENVMRRSLPSTSAASMSPGRTDMSPCALRTVLV